MAVGHRRRDAAEFGIVFPLVLADAERLPLRASTSAVGGRMVPSAHRRICA